VFGCGAATPCYIDNRLNTENEKHGQMK